MRLSGKNIGPGQSLRTLRLGREKERLMKESCGVATLECHGGGMSRRRDGLTLQLRGR